MNKVKEFFMGLNKSTRITIISCGCFVLLTLVILIFFMLFPITPSERVISSIGREGLVYDDGSDDEVVVTTTVTTASDVETVVTTTEVTTIPINSETRMTFTTLDGYIPGGYLATGKYNGNGYQTTTTVTAIPETTLPPEQTTDPGFNVEQPATETPTEPVTDVIVTEPPTEQIVTEPPTEPIVTEPPTPAPTDPPVEPQPTDPPQDTPEQLG